MRTAVAGALAACLVICAAGCAKRPAPRDADPAPPAGMVRITLDVKGMTKALDIT
jgi:hypothetical protein